MFFRVFLSGFVCLLVIVSAFLWFNPIQIDPLVSRAHPSGSFQESLRRIDSLRKGDPQELDPAAQSIVMEHGRKVERAVVFFHGFTNSPRQFKALAEKFYDLGYNVFIPRVPYHGLKGSAAADLRKLTAEDLAVTSDEAVDIARGLGEHVTVVGLSMGGVMVGWVAQFRQDVDRAVLIAPNFGTYRVPGCFLKPSINFLLIKPKQFIWWDAQKKNTLQRPETAYFGFPSRALGEIRRLGWCVQMLGKRSAPAAASVVVVTNANDHAVSKEGIDAVVNNWKKHNAIKVRTYEFPQDLHLGHDLIDPQQTNQNIAVAYPVLMSLITQDNDREKEQ